MMRNRPLTVVVASGFNNFGQVCTTRNNFTGLLVITLSKRLSWTHPVV